VSISPGCIVPLVSSELADRVFVTVNYVLSCSKANMCSKSVESLYIYLFTVWNHC